MPKQLLLPLEKLTNLFSSSPESGPSQRSGLNDFASVKYCSLM